MNTLFSLGELNTHIGLLLSLAIGFFYRAFFGNSFQSEGGRWHGISKPGAVTTVANPANAS